MAKWRILKGEFWEFLAAIWKVRDRVADQVIFDRVSETPEGAPALPEEIIRSDDWLGEHILAGTASKLDKPQAREAGRRVEAVILSPEQQKLVADKAAFIEVLRKAPRGYRSAEALRPSFEDLARRLGWLKAPPRRTVSNWDQTLKQNLGSLLCLAGRMKGAPRRRQIHPIVYSAMIEYFHCEYMVEQGPSLRKVAKGFNKKEIPRLKEKHPELSSRIYPISEGTIRNYEDTIPDEEVIAARKGKAAAKTFAAVFGRGRVYARPLQMVQIDTWKQDLLYTDIYKNVIGRLKMAVVFDCYSRCVLGFYIGPEDARTWTVLQAIRNAILPKSYLKERYPEIVGDFMDLCGMLEGASFDQGPENLNGQIPYVLGELGCTTVYGGVEMPHLRGQIERFFGTLARALIHRLPGATFSNPQDRAAYDSVRKACLTAEEIIRIVHDYIYNEYLVEEHSALGMSPITAFREAAAECQILPPPSLNDLSFLLSQRTTKKIRKIGIEFRNGKYKDKLNQLGKLRQLNDDETEIGFDDGDMGHIWVADNRGPKPRYIFCETTFPEYFDGLTYWQDQAIRGELRTEGKPATDKNLLDKKAEMFSRYRPGRRKSKHKVLKGAAKFQPTTVEFHGMAGPGRKPSEVFQRMNEERMVPRKSRHPSTPGFETAPPVADGFQAPNFARHDIYDNVQMRKPPQ